MAGEEEQVVALKKWWSENGTSTLAGLGIGLAAVVGWQSWQTWERSQAELASERYEQLVADATADRHGQALSGAQALTEEFSDSPYASFASLLAARAAVQTGDPDKAKQHLQWVVEHAAFPELVPIARLRLARLMFEAGSTTVRWPSSAESSPRRFRTGSRSCRATFITPAATTPRPVSPIKPCLPMRSFRLRPAFEFG